MPLTEIFYPSQKLEVIPYADHHSVTAAAMNFSLFHGQFLEASKVALKQASLKARKLSSGPKPHFSKGRGAFLYIVKELTLTKGWLHAEHG